MRARSGRTITGAVAAFLALALAAGACDSGGTSSDGSTQSDDTGAVEGVTLFSERGPYAAGVTTLDLPDREVEVWYPAGTQGVDEAVYYIRDSIPEAIQTIIPEDINPPYVSEAYRDVPASDDGPFPLVLFSHGFGGFSTTSTAITDHLASWGFVVASTDHLERGLESQFGVDVGSDKSDTEVLREVVDLVSAENERSDSVLEGIVSTDEIAVTGHSAGGGAAIAFAAEDDVVTYVPMAASGEGDDEFPGLDTPDKPSLYLAGAIDMVIEPAWTRATYDRAPGPKRLVVIDDVGHLNAFTEICEIGTEGGGVVAIARDLGLPVPESLLVLGEDGCQPEALDSELGWDVTNHFLVAQLREVFGLEEPGTGFEKGIESAFEGVTLTLDEEN
ncbi:MAG: alpha/beta hydrolase [Acidimicrobiia bacterium]